MFGGEALTRPRDAVCNDLYIYDARESRLEVEGRVGRGNPKTAERGGAECWGREEGGLAGEGVHKTQSGGPALREGRQPGRPPAVVRAPRLPGTTPPHPTGKSPSLWFHFPCADRGLKRVGHRTCLWNDQLYLVGGFGEDGRTASPEVCVLDLFI